MVPFHKQNENGPIPEIVGRQIVLYIGARNVDKFHFKKKMQGFWFQALPWDENQKCRHFFLTPFFFLAGEGNLNRTRTSFFLREVRGSRFTRGHVPSKILGTEKMIRVDKSARKKAVSILLTPENPNIPLPN